MSKITLDEIISLAQQESAELKHFYVGAEHLFMALTRIEGGLASSALEMLGLSAKLVRHEIRSRISSGDTRYWQGFLITPRANRILNQARRTLETGSVEDEWALLNTLLEDEDSLPVRVMRALDIDISLFRRRVEEWSREIVPILPRAEVIEETGRLTPDQRKVLEEMFRKYAQVLVEYFFTADNSAYSGATVMLVRAKQHDGREDVPYIVKLHELDAVQLESKRFKEFTRSRLPPYAAHIESDPTIPEHSRYGGLRYKFIQNAGETRPVNLAQYAQSATSAQVIEFLRKSLYDSYKKTWWGQSENYKFTVWQEYEMLLPPALVVEAIPDATVPTTGKVLRPEGMWNRDISIRPGEVIMLEKFTVLKLKRDSGKVRLGRGITPSAIDSAYRVEVSGLDLEKRYRGEVLAPMVVKVVSTRDDLLMRDAANLEPDFNIMENHLPPISGLVENLPNPIRRYRYFLDQQLVGKFTAIHGDLHTGNVLVGPGNVAWLIDFELSRDGHTLFDWAVLEMSLLTDIIAPHLDSAWESLRALLPFIDELNRHQEIDLTHPMAELFRPVLEVRRIASELLGQSGAWAEYFIALAFCALRVVSWKERPLTARRLAFLVSSLAMGTANVSATNIMQTIADVTNDTSSDTKRS